MFANSLTDANRLIRKIQLKTTIINAKNKKKTKKRPTIRPTFPGCWQACVDVTHQTLIGIKLFDWDRTGDHDPLGRFASNTAPFRQSKYNHFSYDRPIAISISIFIYLFASLFSAILCILLILHTMSPHFTSMEAAHALLIIRSFLIAPFVVSSLAWSSARSHFPVFT